MVSAVNHTVRNFFIKNGNYSINMEIILLVLEIFVFLQKFSKLYGFEFCYYSGTLPFGPGFY